MVGVPGKSVGCNTCRKRKIKCDGNKIPCSQCQKSNRVCTGYQRARYFKNLSALDHDSLLARNQPLVPVTKPSKILYDRGAPDKRRDRDSEVREATTLTSQRLTRNGPVNLSNLFVSFLHHYLPKSSLGASATPISWLQIIPNMEEGNTSLLLAVTALGLVRLGRKCHSYEAVSEGMTYYGRALKLLHLTLSKSNFVCDERTLASCMAMSVFENLETSRENAFGWSSHAAGLCKLLELRGPELHITDPGHRLFLGFRATGIIHALSLRRATYLGTPDWLTIPWKILPKTDFHQLLDIVAQIPALIEDSERLVKGSGCRSLTPPKIILLRRSWDFLCSLRKWYGELEERSWLGLFHEQSSLPITSESSHQLDPLFDTSIHFDNFNLARMHLYYWSALIFVYNNIHLIYDSILESQLFPYLSVDPVTHTLPSMQALESKIYDTAKSIGQSMEYLLSEDMHIIGPLNVFFPLRVAMRGFSQRPGLEEAWCRDVFGEIDRRGYPLGKLLCDMDWDEIPRFMASK